MGFDRGFGRGGFNRGFDRGFNRSFAPAPVKEGQEVDVKIEALGEKGDGIAKVDNFVLFVPNTKVGDEVRIKITKVLRKVGFAEVVGKASGPVKAAEKAEETEEETEEKPAKAKKAKKAKEENAEEIVEEVEEEEEASDSEDF